VKCSICSAECGGWKFRYRGDIYCRSCFHDHFELLECVKCHKRKYVHYKTKPHPTCKICLVRDKPCLRCGRPVTRPGRITKNGTVCASCDRYFVEPKRCGACGELKKDVWLREVGENAEPTPMCASCYSKTMKACSRCRRRKKDCLPDENGKPVCRMCRGEPRICRQCGKPFPAGRGRICGECSSMNGMKEKVAFAKGALSGMMAELFEDFSRHLAKERGAEFATHRILYFFPFFQEIDALVGDYPRFPSFEQLLNHFSVANTRRYLSAMRFFETKGLISRSPEAQELYANLDMIERYLETFGKSDPFRDILDGYYRFLDEKQMRGKITVRTVRLSLTPAVRFLEYCRACGANAPGQTILDGYLWCFPGQRNTISGFVSFYNRAYNGSLALSTSRKSHGEPIRLERTRASEARREQLFISMMREIGEKRRDASRYTREDILRISIEYLHDVGIPGDGVVLSFLPVKKRNGEYLIRCAGREFYLPREVASDVKQYETMYK